MYVVLRKHEFFHRESIAQWLHGGIKTGSGVWWMFLPYTKETNTIILAILRIYIYKTCCPVKLIVSTTLRIGCSRTNGRMDIATASTRCWRVYMAACNYSWRILELVVNHLETDFDGTLYYEQRAYKSSRFSSNPEAFASDVLENLGRHISLVLYMHNDMFVQHVQIFHNTFMCHPPRNG